MQKRWEEKSRRRDESRRGKKERVGERKEQLRREEKEQKRTEEKEQKRTEETKKIREIYVIWCEENHDECISVRKNEEKIREKEREPHRKMIIFAKNKRGKHKIFTCMWY